MRRLKLVPRTIRGRLLSGILVLVAVALLGTDIATYLMVRSKLDQRIDGQLARTVAVLDRVVNQQYPLQLTTGMLPGIGPGDINVLLLDYGQRVVAALPQRDEVPGQAALVGVAHSARLVALRTLADQPLELRLAGAPYHVVYHPIGGSPAEHPRLAAMVIALSFENDEETLDHLVTSEAVVSAGFLITLALLALGVLHLGLRPLGTMAATATAIAAGDPTRRVLVDRPGTEVGRLATALNHAFDERRRAEERLRSFVADASHELRTPLTTIRGWADLYFQDGLPQPSDVDNAMGRIADAAGQVGRLVEELLLLARLDEQQPLDTAEVELTALVSDVIADAKVVDASRSITFTANGGKRIVVVGDADRLGQVVRNLVGNALQHTPAGTPIQVSLHASGTGVRLSVADRGPGIAEADQEHLFERFYRAGRRGSGNGLGLAIVRAVVEAHGGTVGVTSRPGEGSRFDVNLPAPPAQEEAT
jgi:two-component system, OmpR family, sensor kinase